LTEQVRSGSPRALLPLPRFRDGARALRSPHDSRTAEQLAAACALELMDIELRRTALPADSPYHASVARLPSDAQVRLSGVLRCRGPARARNAERRGIARGVLRSV